MPPFKLPRFNFRSLAIYLLAPILLSGAAMADPFVKGYEAYNDGDFDRAIAIWTKGANAGQRGPMTALQGLYEDGAEGWDDVAGFAPDPVKASYWRGKADVQFVKDKELETIYFRGLEADRAKNFEAAVRDYTIAAEAGNDQAMNELAIKYYNGQGIKQSDDLAFYWAKKSVDLGNVYAKSQLGMYYRVGVGVEQSFPEALKFFREQEESGEPVALYYLGFMYADGEGIPQSSRKAMDYFKRAKDAGVVGGAQTYIDYQAHVADYERRVAEVNAHNREVDRYNAQLKKKQQQRDRQRSNNGSYSYAQGFQDMARAMSCTRQQQKCYTDSQYQRCHTVSVNVC